MTEQQGPPNLRDDRTMLVVSVSGGKDSTALSLYLHHIGIPHVRVFADTGWEHPETNHYVEEILPRYIGPIHKVEATHQMEDLVRKRGMFPSRLRRFCTQELKVRPLARYVKRVKADLGVAVVNVVGLRAQESMARAVLDEWEYEPQSFHCWVWRPLLRWSLEDVINIHKLYEVPPNPLYVTHGVERVGCWPCIFARKDEIRTVAETDPERIGRIRRLEHDVSESARKRYASRGTSMKQKGYHAPTFFHSKIKLPNGRSMMPIDEVVEWSRTKRGAKEPEPFWEPNQDGCMRWGLCETVGDKGPPKD